MGIFEELYHRIPTGWLIGAAFVALIFAQTGFIQRLFRGRSEERISAADRLSEDQRDLLTRTQEQVDNEHDWRLKDAEDYQEQIAGLWEQVRQRDATISHLAEAANASADAARSSERGNARLRHALRNVLQQVAALYQLLRRHNVSLPPYEGWRNFLDMDPDLDQKLRELFESKGLDPEGEVKIDTEPSSSQ